MTLSRTRIINTLIGLLILAVAALAAVPWLVPRIQEAARDEPDSDLVLAAVKKHQTLLDAEWTNPEASRRHSGDLCNERGQAHQAHLPG